MRIVVIGCTLTTRRCLEQLLGDNEDQITLIVTLDSSLHETKSRYASLHDLATQHDVPLLEVTDVNDSTVVERIRHAAPDVVLEIGWSQMIKRDILDIAPLGCVGIHDSLLPKAQGAASVNWALIWGEPTWGLSLFYLEEQFDKGDVIGQREYEISEDDDINTLFDKADVNAVDLLREMVPRLREGTAPRIPQDPALITKTRRRRPEDGVIDWRQTNREVYNLVRALKRPYPPAFTFARGQKILVLDARRSDDASLGAGVISSVRADGMVIGTGRQSVLVLLFEKEGGEEADAITFSRELGLRVGDRFGD